MRPAYSLLDKSKIKEVFSINVPHYKDSLRRCMRLWVPRDIVISVAIMSGECKEVLFLLAHGTFFVSGVCFACSLRSSVWIFDLPWCKRNKRSSLKIKNLKTTSKLCSAARAVCLSGSSRGLLPLHFFVFFDVFNLRAG